MFKLLKKVSQYFNKTLVLILIDVFLLSSLPLGVRADNIDTYNNISGDAFTDNAAYQKSENLPLLTSYIVNKITTQLK